MMQGRAGRKSPARPLKREVCHKTKEASRCLPIPEPGVGSVVACLCWNGHHPSKCVISHASTAMIFWESCPDFDALHVGGSKSLDCSFLVHCVLLGSISGLCPLELWATLPLTIPINVSRHFPKHLTGYTTRFFLTVVGTRERNSRANKSNWAVK